MENKSCVVLCNYDGFVYNWKYYNLGQKVKEKFENITKVSFFMESFMAAFLLFFKEKHQNLSFCWTNRYSPSHPSISGIFLKCPNFVKSEFLSRLATSEATQTFTLS